MTPDPSGSAPLPADDPTRAGVHHRPEGDEVTHLAVVGDTYSILVAGTDTDQKYTLIDMLIPRGGGPPAHRHDFEEMFTVLAGEIEVTFRDQQFTARVGDSANIPANAPHRFTNQLDLPAHLLCVCAPAGQDEWFKLIGDPLPSRDSPHPHLSEDDQRDRLRRMIELAPRYRTEFLI